MPIFHSAVLSAFTLSIFVSMEIMEYEFRGGSNIVIFAISKYRVE